MIPKLRLDALTDGIFAMAMTLLVLDLRLPEGLRALDNGELLQRLLELRHQILIYGVSFYVLALAWVGHVRSTGKGEEVGQRHVALVLSYLFLITFLPFATSVIGRFPEFPAAVWIYAGNMTLLALVSLRLVMLSNVSTQTKQEAWSGLGTLIGAAAVAVILSFVMPAVAIFAFGLNFLETPVKRLLRRR